ncbi:MAG: hypothetical protein JWL90_3680, partial [Chthoniobacteraceae bacterium]|nr:hypothetical protein [Chthoniobacteraceae bacterium]
DHEEDPKFLVDHHDHLSARGWIYYDEVIDAFFHNRLDLPGVPQPAPSPL